MAAKAKRRAAVPGSRSPVPAWGTGGLPVLDRVIHERLRLAIVSALASRDMMSFNELKTLLKTTDGNLSVHARRLEEAGYVACDKSFAGRIPRTTYRLTAEGRRALERYLAHLEAVIAHARGG
jgi:DNA-binding transcriptional ArsR family regulator